MYIMRIKNPERLIVVKVLFDIMPTSKLNAVASI